MKEVFVPIQGYDGKYLIGNQGSVKTLALGGRKFYQYMNTTVAGNGYRVVGLKGKLVYVHRLVALHFVPNPDNKKIVHHKNEDTLDNRAENLAWVTKSENLHYGTALERMRAKKERPILRISIETGEVLQRYPSLKAASAEGFNRSSLSSCANGGRIKTSAGFLWRWE